MRLDSWVLAAMPAVSVYYREGWVVVMQGGGGAHSHECTTVKAGRWPCRDEAEHRLHWLFVFPSQGALALELSRKSSEWLPMSGAHRTQVQA